MKTTYKPIAAIVDTNSVFTKSLDATIANGFIGKWKQIKSDNPHYTLLIPDVVVLERSQQRYKVAKDSRDNAQKNLKNLNTVSGRKKTLNFSDKELREAVESSVRKTVKKHFDEIVEVPFDSIDWKDVYTASIRRLPPFSDDETEKGFKDRMILESIAAVISNKSARHDIVAITNDGLLGDAIRARFDNDIEVVDSLTALEAYDRLRKDEHASKVAAKLLRKARAKFFSDKDPGCLWYKEKIHHHLMTNHGAGLRPENVHENIFGDNVSGHRWLKWKQKTSPWSIIGTRFDCHTDAKIYTWLTKLNYKQIYYDMFTDTDGRFSSSPYTLDAQFEIRWSSQVSTDGKFRNLELASVDLITVALNKSSDESDAFDDLL